jgi:hypothetical protein
VPKENEILMQAPPGVTCVAHGADAFTVDADGLFLVPHSIAVALLATPLLGVARAPEAPAKAKGK